jgi:hypothetical protein
LFLNLVVFFFFCFVSSSFIIVGFLVLFYFYFYVLSVLLTSPSLSSHPYSYILHFVSFSCATIHCYSSQLLFLPFLIHSFSLSLSPPSILSQPITILSLLHKHNLLTSLLYQLYTTPCNPWHKHLTLQQTHTRATKPSRPYTLPPLTHPTYHSPLLVPP